MVEDEEDVRTLIHEILKSTGYEVLEAGSADEAINFCRNQNNSVNLILTDVIMPKMNGPELVKKCAEFRKDLKILYLSGYTNNTIINHGVLETGVAFLQKPFTAENLLNKVWEALNSSSHDGWKKN
ncbi:MAG: response regulator [Calditrichia bacterium]